VCDNALSIGTANSNIDSSGRSSKKKGWLRCIRERRSQNANSEKEGVSLDVATTRSTLLVLLGA
jgi:hypothetical protein